MDRKRIGIIVIVVVLLVALLGFCSYVSREAESTSKEFRETSIGAEDAQARWARKEQKTKIEKIKIIGGEKNVEKMEN